MEKQKTSLKNTGRAPRFLLLMPDEIRHAVERSAFAAGRTVTAEINLRLRESLKDQPAPGIAPSALPITYPTANHLTAHHTGESDNALTLSATDHAMLQVFHSLPVEKQLALLSLFK